MNTLNDFDNEFIKLQPSLMSYLYRLSANKFDAEDIVQESYIKAKEKLYTFSSKSTVKTWVFAIATNIARDNQRVRNRWALDAQDLCKQYTISHKECSDKIENSFRSQTFLQFEIIEHINYCFTCLSKNLNLEKQIALILKEFYQFKVAEIAEILNISTGVAKHLLHNGRAEMQQKFDFRCALINKKGICYQCAELNDYLEKEKTSEIKIKSMGFSNVKSVRENYKNRVKLISKINPLEDNGSSVEDTIMQILREAISDG